MQCVAASGPYVVGAIGGLRLMGRRARRERDAPADEATPSADEPEGVPAGS
jgi:hypothetical protein